ncbi:hypothetical protein HUJ05_006639 [Dendroctonus ponderosae]|nr:hypothetical protein HUJ05_006639 [Dendroctonus ponderosae]
MLYTRHFADDLAVMAQDKDTEDCGLTINASKAKYMCIVEDIGESPVQLSFTCVRLSLHHFLGRQMSLRPNGDLSRAVLTSLQWSILFMCSFHSFFLFATHSLMLLTSQAVLTFSLLSLSRSVYPIKAIYQQQAKLPKLQSRKQEPPISQFAMIIAKCIEVGLEEELLIFVEIILLFHSLWTFLHVVYGKCIQSIHGRSLPVD